MGCYCSVLKAISVPELVSVRRQFQEARGRDGQLNLQVKGEKLKLMSRELERGRIHI
jgi:hypothetical protein